MPNPECTYETVSPGRFRCPRCGHEEVSEVFQSWQLHRHCPALKPTDEAPSIMQRAVNFAKSVFAQAPLVAEALLTGDESAAFRSKEEIEAIAAVCKTCPLFNGQVCTHRDCGCVIDEERSVMWSKIAYRSAHCPDNPPRWS